MKYSSAGLALLLSLSLDAVANPIANGGAPAKPARPPKCRPATLCVDGLLTCADKAKTTYMRWGNCYNTCKETLTRPTCTKPFTDVTDVTATAAPNAGDPAPTATITEAPSTANAVVTTKTKDDGGKGPAQTGTIRVPSDAWKKVEDGANHWWGWSMLRFPKDSLQKDGAAA